MSAPSLGRQVDLGPGVPRMDLEPLDLPAAVPSKPPERCRVCNGHGNLGDGPDPCPACNGSGQIGGEQ